MSKLDTWWWKKRSERERFADATLLALKMEEGASSQGALNSKLKRNTNRLNASDFKWKCYRQLYFFLILLLHNFEIFSNVKILTVKYPMCHVLIAGNGLRCLSHELTLRVGVISLKQHHSDLLSETLKIGVRNTLTHSQRRFGWSC